MITRTELLEIFAREPTEHDFSAAWQGWDLNESDFPEQIDDCFFPNREVIFRALELIAPENVNYVILGQDPYFVSKNSGTPDEVPAAIGVAFGINNQYEPTPQSLSRIKKSIYVNGIGPPDLIEWAQANGILLLNAALTVPRPGNRYNGRGCAGKHLKYWKRFTSGILNQVRNSNPNVKLIALGSPARDILVKIFGRNDPSVWWFYHPVASVAGARSFMEFGQTFPELCER